MTIVAIDDTDSREDGMCTTYVAVRLAERIAAAGGRVERRLLVRLNPAVKHKTRGNAAVALCVADLDARPAFDLACEAVREFAVVDDPRTSPGVVVADLDVAVPTGPGFGAADASATIPDDVAAFARRALRRRLTVAEAVELADAHGFSHAGFGEGDAEFGGEDPDADERDAESGEGTRDPSDPVIGRGRIGALAAVGAPAAFDDWTVERISYREFHRCGTPRDVDVDAVFAAADEGYPAVWDTVDRGTGEAVCVPNAPGPILHGIRGDDPDACRTVAERIGSEPVDRAATFHTNQGADVHLAAGGIGDLRDGAGYRVDGVVASEPETRRGGHVHVDVAALPEEREKGEKGEKGEKEARRDEGNGRAPPLRCVAFAPTGRFREHVRALRPGDRVTVCGECAIRPVDPASGADAYDGGGAGTDRDGSEGRGGDRDGNGDGNGSDTVAPRETLKLEKLAVRGLVRTEPATPTCPDCERTMSSAGRGQGYRCRDCGTDAPGKTDRPIDRALSLGWYEVPPAARRHVAKPLIRGGFDGPVHPER